MKRLGRGARVTKAHSREVRGAPAFCSLYAEQPKHPRIQLALFLNTNTNRQTHTHTHTKIQIRAFAISECRFRVAHICGEVVALPFAHVGVCVCVCVRCMGGGGLMAWLSCSARLTVVSPRRPGQGPRQGSSPVALSPDLSQWREAILRSGWLFGGLSVSMRPENALLSASHYRRCCSTCPRLWAGGCSGGHRGRH